MGILVDSKLKFDIHIDAVAASAAKMLGYVLCARLLNVKTIICLYSSLVLSKLSFGSVIWNPTYAIYIDQLKRIQRRFLKFIYFKSFHESNAAMAQEYFYISPLATKQTISDMFLYKIVINSIDSSDLVSMIIKCSSIPTLLK